MIKVQSFSEPGLALITSAIPPYREQLFDCLHGEFHLTVFLNGTKHQIHPWDKVVETKYSVNRLKVFDCIRLLRQEVLVVTPWADPKVFWLVVFRALYGAPTLAIYESTMLSHRFRTGLIKVIRNFLFRRMSAVITVGVASTHAVEEMGVKKTKVFEGFNAVENEFYRSTVKKYRSQQSFSKKNHNVIFIGQLIDRKNVADAIRAWKQVRLSEDVFFVIGDGPQREFLSSLALELGIGQFVRFTGYLNQDEICSYLARTHTLILPSKQEVWGLVVNEALAAGLHVVVSDRCGVAMSVQDMKGVYVSTCDIESFSQSLKLSREEWSGYIDSPMILKHGIKELASVIRKAILYAVENNESVELC